MRLKESLEGEWATFKAVNLADRYVLSVILTAEDVADRLERAMEDGLELSKGYVDAVLDDEYLTQAMREGVLRLLRRYWAFSEELRWT